jgi:prevent-host-death family protein
MEKAISSAEANRKFSQVLREVREGHSYIVTSHGKPVARIAPAEEARSENGRNRLLRHLRSQPVRNIGRWTRDELYE